MFLEVFPVYLCRRFCLVFLQNSRHTRRCFEINAPFLGFKFRNYFSRGAKIIACVIYGMCQQSP